jgi:hypothetical protein
MIKNLSRLRKLVLVFGLCTAVLASVLAGTALAAGSCDKTTTSDQLKQCIQNDPVTKDIELIVNVLSAGVGIVVIGMIIVGGIQYSIAGDNSQATAAAKQRIVNALIALFAYLFIFAFIQWLIPGGLFG